MGHKIREIFETQSLPVAAFAARIGIARQNVYRLFEKKDLDTGLLMKISQALTHDFFRYFSPLPDQPSPEVAQTPPSATLPVEPETAAELAHCQRELDLAHQEIDYLKRMVSLMEERIAYLSRQKR